MSTEKILLIDDEIESSPALTDLFESLGFRVFTANNGFEGLEIARVQSPDVVILDLVMEPLDGFGVLRRLRANPITQSIPVIIYSVTGDDWEKRLQALREGADDYLPKILERVENVPRTLGLDMLRAAVMRALKRVELLEQRVGKVKGFFQIELASRVAVIGGVRKPNLTPLEFKLFQLLVRKLGEVVSRDEIVEELYPLEVYPEGVDDYRIEALVRRLRQKIESTPREPTYLLTRNGFGYTLVEPKQESN